MRRVAAVVTPSANPDLGALFEREGDRIFGFLLNRCGSRTLAEDLTAETFLSASKQYAAGRADDVTPGWLVIVARRRLVDYWRSLGAQRRRTDRLVSEFRRRAGSANDVDTGVDEVLLSLPERYRAALVLRYLDDFSVSEVAEVLELSYKATESLLSRARAAFTSAYENRHVD